jgi:molecular chaperone GrpE
VNDVKQPVEVETPLGENPQADIAVEKMEDSEKEAGKKGRKPRALKKIKEKLKKKEAEAKEHYDRLLRVSAEFENFKKRSERQAADFRKFASEEVFKELLPIVDNLGRALDASEDSDCKVIIEGVNMTLKQLRLGFEKFGVVPIEALGNPFDPRFHEAVMKQESSTQPSNIVIEELQKGYMIKDRLLRPSMVVVSAPPASGKADLKSDEN